MTTRRYQELDALRGIAALAVLVSHYTYNFDLFFPGHEPFPVDVRWGAYGVHLFFMISGFVILMTAQRHRSPGSFSQARALRLYPTYWVCLSLTVATVFGTGFAQLYRPGWEIAINCTMLQSFVAVRDFDGVYWSLAREIVFYILIAAALKLFRGNLPRSFILWFPLAWAAGGTAVICAGSWAGGTLAKIAISASVAQYAALFGVGMVCYAAHREGSLPPVVWPLVALAGVNEGLMQGPAAGLVVVLLAVVFVLVTRAGSVPVLRQGWLLWLGGISYPLYLLHQNIGYVVIGRTVDGFGPWVSRALAVLVSLLLAWAVHELVEVRATRALSGVLRTAGERRRSAAGAAASATD